MRKLVLLLLLGGCSAGFQIQAEQTYNKAEIDEKFRLYDQVVRNYLANLQAQLNPRDEEAK